MKEKKSQNDEKKNTRKILLKNVCKQMYFCI